MDNTINIYKPKAVINILMNVFTSVIVVGTIIAWVILLVNIELDWFFGLVTVGAGFLLYEGIRMLVAQLLRKIVIDKESIYVKKDKKSGFRIIQHDVNVLYSEIKDIRLVFTSADTTGKEQFGLFTPMPNICFECGDGELKMINVYRYSKHQVVDILNDVIIRAQAVGNLAGYSSGEELYSKFLDENHSNKKGK